MNLIELPNEIKDLNKKILLYGIQDYDTNPVDGKLDWDSVKSEFQTKSDTSHTITQAGWIRIAKLTSTQGRGSYEISTKIGSGINTDGSLIYFEVNSNTITGRLTNVVVSNAAPSIQGVGLIDSDGDDKPWVGVKVTHTGMNYSITTRFKSLNTIGTFTPSTTAGAEILTMDVEFLFGTGNNFSSSVMIGKGTPTEKLDVEGSIRAKGSFKVNTTNQSAVVQYYDNDVLQWKAGVYASPKNWGVVRYDDAGSYVGYALAISRATGNVFLGGSGEASEKLEVLGNVKANNVTIPLNTDLDEIEAAGYNLDVNGNAGLLQIIGALWSEIKDLKQRCDNAGI